MKRKISLYVASLILAVTIFLNLSIDSKAGQLVDTTVIKKGPVAFPCEDSSGNIYSYATLCPGGTHSCVSSTCPPEPTPPPTTDN